MAMFCHYILPPFHPRLIDAARVALGYHVFINFLSTLPWPSEPLTLTYSKLKMVHESRVMTRASGGEVEPGDRLRSDSTPSMDRFEVSWRLQQQCCRIWSDVPRPHKLMHPNKAGHAAPWIPITISVWGIPGSSCHTAKQEMALTETDRARAM